MKIYRFDLTVKLEFEDILRVVGVDVPHSEPRDADPTLISKIY